MVAATYETALARLLQHEGGYTNHPSDPGGPTNFGITIYDARRYAAEFNWISGREVSALDVKAMPLWFAKRVYRKKYWDSQRCDELESGVDYAIFDYGVNSGIGRSGRVLRRLVSMPDTSSEVTPEVVAAAQAMMALQTVGRICDERLQFLHSLNTWPTFGGGWGRRVLEVRQYGVKIAQDLPLIGSPPVVPAPGRAIDADKFARVRALQASLLGAPGQYAGALDGDLGPQTVRAFQRSRGLYVDGVVGTVTQPLLDAALAGIQPMAPAH